MNKFYIPTLNNDIEKWSSINFYKNLKNKIHNILLKNNINSYLFPFDNINDINDILFLTPVELILLKFKNNLHLLNNKKYILIIGENVDLNKNTFIGWELSNIYFDEQIKTIFNNALLITYQNNINKEFFKSNKTFFFPIDGYTSELEKLTFSSYSRTIDYIYYGALPYERRTNFAIYLFLFLCKEKNLIILDNYFDIDDYLLKSKINIHVNSLDNLYHIPYAKLIKPMLLKNKMMIEFSEELENDNLKNFITTFKINNLKIPNFNYNYYSSIYLNEKFNFDKEGILLITESRFLFILLKTYFYKNQLLHPVKKILTSRFSNIEDVNKYKDWLIIYTSFEDNKYKINSNSNLFKKTTFSLKEEFLFKPKKNLLNKVLLEELNNFKENNEQTNYIKNNYNLERNLLNLLNLI